MFLTYSFFLWSQIAPYIQAKREYTCRNRKKKLLFPSRDCFIQTGGRKKAILQMLLAIEMKVLEIEVKMQVLIFCQEMNKGTDIYIRGYVHEENAGCVETASIFGSVFTYCRKAKKQQRNWEAVPITTVASSKVTERNIFG